MKIANAKQLEGHTLRARDGDIGDVRDFYFDDHHWNIRYCVIETGQWLQSRRVLIAPESIRAYDWNLKMFPVELTMDQVRNSPDVDTAKPVSRQHEEELRRYYGWPPYWGLALADGGIVPAMPMAMEMDDSIRPPVLTGDPRLRSINDTIGYHIEALDGAIGHAVDFLLDTTNWRVRYLVIDTKNWLPGKKVIIAPAWIHHVSWTEAQISVDLTREVIQASPEYEPARAWDPEYGIKLHDYYRHSRHHTREELLAAAGGKRHEKT